MNVLAHSFIFWIALILALLALYVLPTVIAMIRHVEGLGWIIVINLLPTGVGWLAALIAAIALPREEPTLCGWQAPQSDKRDAVLAPGISAWPCRASHDERREANYHASPASAAP